MWICVNFYWMLHCHVNCTKEVATLYRVTQAIAPKHGELCSRVQSLCAAQFCVDSNWCFMCLPTVASCPPTCLNALGLHMISMQVSLTGTSSWALVQRVWCSSTRRSSGGPTCRRELMCTPHVVEFTILLHNEWCGSVFTYSSQSPTDPVLTANPFPKDLICRL